MDESNDLRRPLRRRRLRDHLAALRPGPFGAAALALALTLGGLWAWSLANPDPLGGEPVVYARIDLADPIVTGKTDAEPTPEQAEEEAAPDPSPEDVLVDQALVEPSEPSHEGETRSAPLAPAPIRAVTEKGPFGPLPRIAANGRKPWQVYAGRAPSAAARSDEPRIAIVLGGMGLNEALTRRAIRDLPGGVTFAFAPYGEGLQRLVNEARADGHEIMLHLPMEPFGYPSVDPGPKTLLTSAAAGQNLDNLLWCLSRFSGYTGVINYMGARFTGERTAFQPVVQELGRRGLVYLDDGSSARSLADELGQAARLPVRRADRLIDAAGGFDQTLNGLRSSEAGARQTGFSMVIGSGLASTIEAVQSWARGAAERGVLIVPASHAFRADAS